MVDALCGNLGAGLCLGQDEGVQQYRPGVAGRNVPAALLQAVAAGFCLSPDAPMEAR